MKKIIKFVFLLLIGISCHKIQDKKLQQSIRFEIEQNKSLDFSNYTDFQWDSVILLSPYTNIQSLEKEKDLDLSGISKDIEMLDNINVLVFLKDKKMVKYVEIHRELGDFGAEYKVIILKKNNMKLKFKYFSSIKMGFEGI